MSDNITFLKTAQAFESLNEEQLRKIEAFCSEKTFSKGDVIFHEGDNADHIWCVKEGEVDLRFDLPSRRTSREYTISIRKEKNIFGWSFLVPPHKYRLSAYCATDTCKVIRLDKNRLLRLFKEDKLAGYQFMSNLIKVVGDRFLKLQESVAGHRPIE
jgi:CRP/FNR family transcriptional regulator